NHVKCSAPADMTGRAVEAVEEMGTAWTGQRAIWAVHETVQNERSMRTEQLGHLHLLGHLRLADALEDIVRWNLAARRQRPPSCGYGFDLRPKSHLRIQKCVASGA